MTQNILLFLTGLVFLVFGILRLSTEMQRIFSVRIRQYIKQLVKKPIQGVGLGAITTAVFQSSSATTVLTVGLVSAGLISFFNSLGLVLGADIGTTITAQLVAFKITAIAPVFIILGIGIWLIGKDKQKSIGEAIFYFGLLFFGLSLMGQAMSPLKNSETFISLIQQTKNPLLGVLIGFVFTAIVQSSSATTSILVLLAQQGLISIENGLPMVLGASIGTTITALLASIGSSVNGKRTAFSHLFFRFLAALIIFPFLPYFISFLQYLTSSVGQQIATGYLLFSLVLVLIFFFWLKPFARFVKKIIPGEEKILPMWAEYLNEKDLSNPSKALQGIEKELHRGALLTKEIFFRTKSLILKFNESAIRDISYIELVIDNLQTDVMRFLDKLPKEKMTKDQTVKLIQYSAIIDNIERIGDHIDNVSKLARHKHDAGLKFTKVGIEELQELSKLLTENINDVIAVIKHRGGERVQNILKREDQVDKMVEKAQESHLERFYQREVSIADGPIFNDILINFERISDHCVNIAEYYK